MTKSHVFFCFLVWLCTALIFSPAILSHAANSLNFPEENGYSAGIFTREVSDRDIFEHDDLLSNKVDLSYDYVQISYGIFEDLAVDLRLGNAEYEISWIKYGSGTSWGVGLRSRLFAFEEQNMILGAGFQYDKYNPDDTFRNGHYFSPDPDEWSISIDLARYFGRFGISGGIEYSELALPFEHPERGRTREGGFEQDNELGIFIGAEVEIIGGLGITGEAHFAADESYTLGLYYKF